MLTHSEENYIKSIYNLSVDTNRPTTTNAIADKLNTKAASTLHQLESLDIQISRIEFKTVDYES